MLQEFSYDETVLIRHEMDNYVEINFFKKYAIGFCVDNKLTKLNSCPMIFKDKDERLFWFHVGINSVIKYGFPEVYNKYFN